MIRAALLRLRKSEFSRQVMTLMTGTGLGQLIGLLLAPVVSRLYSPEEFSTLEQFAMLLAILGVLSTGKYEFAIMQPRQEERAAAIVNLAIRIAAMVSGLVLLIVLAFPGSIASLFNNEDLAVWLILLAPALFMFSVFNTLNYWFGRKKQFKSVAIGKMAFSLVSEPSKIGLGALGQTAGGLVISVTLGHLLSGGQLLWKYIKETPSEIRKSSSALRRLVATEYRDYPLYTIWGSLFNRLAQWAHILLFAKFYGLLAVGYFALTRRVLYGPLTLLSGSFSQVFYQRISEIQDPAHLRRFYYKNLIRFTAFSALMVVVVLILPAGTMAWIFGEEWAPVQEFLDLLIFWYVLNFITSSLSFINYRLKKQKGMFLLDFSHFVVVVSAILLAWQAGYSEMQTVKVLVLAKVIYFTINIFASIYFIESYTRKQLRE